MSEVNYQDEGNLRRLRALRPIDDMFMRVMFQGQLELAQEVLRIITGVGDLVLLEEETQRDLSRLSGSRGVCLDVFGVDGEGRLYDLEVQRDDLGASPRRARYHSAAMDIEALDAGSDFESLPESYVVFLTENDVLGSGLGLYRFERREHEMGLPLGDGAHVIYADASHEFEGELGDLMHDFMCSNPDEMRNEAMANRVRYLKESPKGVGSMCKIMEEMKEEARAEGRAEGRVEGRAEGRAEVSIAMISNAMESFGITAEKAMEALKVPMAERPRYLAML